MCLSTKRRLAVIWKASQSYLAMPKKHCLHQRKGLAQQVASLHHLRHPRCHLGGPTTLGRPRCRAHAVRQRSGDEPPRQRHQGAPAVHPASVMEGSQLRNKRSRPRCARPRLIRTCSEPAAQLLPYAEALSSGAIRCGQRLDVRIIESRTYNPQFDVLWSSSRMFPVQIVLAGRWHHTPSIISSTVTIGS